MTIRSKIIACLAGMVVLFGLLSLYQYRKSHISYSKIALVNDLFLPLSRQIVSIQSNIQGYVEDSKRFYFSQSTPDANGFSRMARDVYPHVVYRKFQAIETLLLRVSAGSKVQVIEDLQNHLSRSKSLFQRLTETTSSQDFDSVFVQLKASMSMFSKVLDEESQKLTATVQKDSKESAITYTALSVFILIFGVISVFLSYRALSPLPELINSIKMLGGGKLDMSFKVSRDSRDEVSVMAREFNRMIEALKERDKKILEQQATLLQSEKLAAVGQLSAQVVHEIRNPLNSMSLNVDWLQEELTEEKEEIKKTLVSISREIQRLNQITESYLVRARVNSADNNKAALNEVIRELIEFESVERGNIEIKTELTREELYVKIDRSRLKQAFINIIKNAKEAMPKGGKLIVRTELKNNVSVVHFSDTGHGMNDTVARQTQKPFFTTKENGTGLGLSLTRTIVEEARGTLSCISELGKGTTFTLQFPV